MIFYGTFSFIHFHSSFLLELITLIFFFLHVNRSEVNNVIHTLHVTSLTAPLYKNVWDHGGAPKSRNQEGTASPAPLCAATSEMCKFHAFITYSIVPVLCYCQQRGGVADTFRQDAASAFGQKVNGRRGRRQSVRELHRKRLCRLQQSPFSL